MSQRRLPHLLLATASWVFPLGVHAQTTASASAPAPASAPLATATPATPASAPAASYHLSLSYIPAGQGGAGQIASATYPSGKVLTYQYDATGQLTGLLWNGQALVSHLTWTPLGQPKSWRWPFVTGASDAQGPGLAVSRSFNTAGQLTDSGIASYSWDAAGRVSSITQQLLGPAASGASAQPAAATAFTLTSALSYDAAGRLTGMQHSLPAGLPAGMRVQDVIGPLRYAYTFDANGNRQSASYQGFAGSGNTQAIQRSFSLDAAHNKVLAVADTLTLADASSEQQTRTLQWDSSGRLLGDGQLSFSHDPQGRVARITGLGHDSRYQSNALGQRVRKTTDGKAVDTVYGEEEMAPGLASYPIGHYQPSASASTSTSTSPSSSSPSPSSTPEAEYIWLPTASGPMPIAAELKGQLYAIHTDHLNTPRRLSDAAGNPVWQWVTSPFGEVEATDASTGFTRSRLSTGTAPTQALTPGPIAFTLRYPGQQFDAETGLHYNHHRYYDPYLTVGYTQADPIGLQGGWNRFTYVGGNALGDIDPEGLVVQICSRPIDISWIPDLASRNVLPYHRWVKTDSTEVGMGAACNVPGQGCSDIPGTKTYTRDHSNQSQNKNSSCKVIQDVDEQCVNAKLKLGQYTGRWMPWNQCQSFAREVIDKCTPGNKPYIGYPHLNPRR